LYGIYGCGTAFDSEGTKPDSRFIAEILRPCIGSFAHSCWRPNGGQYQGMQHRIQEVPILRYATAAHQTVSERYLRPAAPALHDSPMILFKHHLSLAHRLVLGPGNASSEAIRERHKPGRCRRVIRVSKRNKKYGESSVAPWDGVQHRVKLRGGGYGLDLTSIHQRDIASEMISLDMKPMPTTRRFYKKTMISLPNSDSQPSTHRLPKLPFTPTTTKTTTKTISSTTTTTRTPSNHATHHPHDPGRRPPDRAILRPRVQEPPALLRHHPDQQQGLQQQRHPSRVLARDHLEQRARADRRRDPELAVQMRRFGQETRLG
jgi:hypothetical protein